jgi:glycolate oxidase FAD binding subunit
MTPKSIPEIQEAVRALPKLHARGAGTKTALHTNHDAEILDMRHLSGVIEYDPQEFVLTAYAGTPVAEIEKLLAEKGQYLPFDPLLSERGATLGGTVAANASGPGRFRYGGVRDFLIGAKFVDGNGTLLRGGGKVVKNAAGFDYPKLMVGALGKLGVLVELTFKVFPKPEGYMTLCIEKSSLGETIKTLYTLNTTPLDVETLDFGPVAPTLRWLRSHQAAAVPSAPSPVGTGEGFWLAVRVGGLVNGLAARMERIQQLIGAGEVLRDEHDLAFWRGAREFDWAPSGTVTKIPITPERIEALERELDAKRRYSVGGNVAYVAAPFIHDSFDSLALLGTAQPTKPRAQHAFAQRIKQALDPRGKFS